MHADRGCGAGHAASAGHEQLPVDARDASSRSDCLDAGPPLSDEPGETSRFGRRCGLRRDQRPITWMLGKERQRGGGRDKDGSTIDLRHNVSRWAHPKVQPRKRVQAALRDVESVMWVLCRASWPHALGELAILGCLGQIIQLKVLVEFLKGEQEGAGETRALPEVRAR